MEKVCCYQKVLPPVVTSGPPVATGELRWSFSTGYPLLQNYPLLGLLPQVIQFHHWIFCICFVLFEFYLYPKLKETSLVLFSWSSLGPFNKKMSSKTNALKQLQNKDVNFYRQILQALCDNSSIESLKAL